jgi:hypothetical protein
MTLTPEILTIYILDLLFLFFATIAFILSLQIIKSWNFDSNSKLQYSLEKKSYLGSTIIRYMFYIKLPLFLFFIFTLDKISFILPGAMCGAGVVNANEYATVLLFLKLVNLYLFAYWIVLDKQDMQDELQKYLKQKFTIFIALFTLLIFEIVLEYIMFSSIDVKDVVDCCGAIFSTNDNTYLSKALSLSPSLLLSLFYLNFSLLVVSAIFSMRYIFSLLNLLFIFISLLSLVAFFGTYIYELPTHHCPFCFLQQEYSYVGYFLYGVLFVGTFNGLVVGFVVFSKEEVLKRYRVSILFNLIYLIVVTLYPILFFMRNGVWL